VTVCHADALMEKCPCSGMRDSSRPCKDDVGRHDRCSGKGVCEAGDGYGANSEALGSESHMRELRIRPYEDSLHVLAAWDAAMTFGRKSSHSQSGTFDGPTERYLYLH